MQRTGYGTYTSDRVEKHISYYTKIPKNSTSNVDEEGAMLASHHGVLIRNDGMEAGGGIHPNVDKRASGGDGEMCVLIVAPHPLTRLGMKSALDGLGRVLRVVDACDLDGALSRLVEDMRTGKFPELIIIDAMLLEQEGGGRLAELRDHCPMAPIVLNGSVVNHQLARDTLRFGVAGFIPNSMETRLIPIVLRFILEGGVYIPAELLEYKSEQWEMVEPEKAAEGGAKLGHLVPGGDLPIKLQSNFTERQIDVIKLMIQGQSNKEISRKLQISPGTVKNHIAQILLRIGTTSRARAIGMLYQLSSGQMAG